MADERQLKPRVFSPPARSKTITTIMASIAKNKRTAGLRRQSVEFVTCDSFNVEPESGAISLSRSQIRGRRSTPSRVDDVKIAVRGYDYCDRLKDERALLAKENCAGATASHIKRCVRNRQSFLLAFARRRVGNPMEEYSNLPSGRGTSKRPSTTLKISLNPSAETTLLSSPSTPQLIAHPTGVPSADL